MAGNHWQNAVLLGMAGHFQISPDTSCEFLDSIAVSVPVTLNLRNEARSLVSNLFKDLFLGPVLDCVICFNHLQGASFICDRSMMGEAPNAEKGECHGNSARTPVALDGGYGWTVVAASFLAYFIADGWAYSFGIFYPDLLDVFNEGKGKTALIGALLYGVPLLVSPVICALTTVYGCQKVAITGGLVTGVSFILSSMATSVDFLCLTTGVISSIGLAMTYIPSLLIVTFYFEKHRGLATGLAVTGSGLGAFAFPPFVEYLLSQYAWRGTLLIIGAICFNIIVAGALFRPLSLDANSAKHTDSHEDSDNKVLLQVKPGEVVLPQLHEVHPNQTSTSLNDISMTQDEDKSMTFLSAGNKSAHPIGHNTHHKLTRTAQSCPNVYSSQVWMDSVSSVPNQAKAKSLNIFWSELQMIVRSMMDKSLLNVWQYLVFCAASFFLFLWAGVPYVYLVDEAILQGISEHKAAFLLSTIGISRTVGQVILGILGDQSKVNTTQLYASCITVAGLATILVPACTTYETLCLYCVVFGFTISVTYCITMMLLVDIVGLHRATNAFGLLQLVMGISTLLGTPVAGNILHIHHITQLFIKGQTFVFPSVIYPLYHCT